MRRLLLGVVIWIGVMAGCEVIEAPYFEPDYLNSLPAEDLCFLEAQGQEAFPEGYVFTKKVFLEKMTGHRCGNCPPAATEGIRLLEENPNQLIYLSIHAGPLANFSSTASKYNANFKTETGDELFSTLNTAQGVPFGMIDRVFTSIDEQSWQTDVQNRLETPATAGINIVTCYDADSQKLAVVIRSTYLEEVSTADRLSVYLVEDQVIDWQKNYSLSDSDVPNYSHRQVLRSAFNGTFGELLTGEPIVPRQVYTKGYALTLDSAWDINNCRIIAFLHHPDTYEVRQVEQISIQ
ncbi:MAG: Omp28-related outer membrane protein [Bacteroidota bacterium]